MKDWLRATRIEAWAGILGVRRWHLASSAALSLAVAALDGLSVGLLVPIAAGVASRDLSGALELPIVGRLAEWLLTSVPAGSDSFAVLLLLFSGLAFGAAIAKSALAYVSHLFGSYWYGVYEKRAYVHVLGCYLGFGKRYFDLANQGAVQAVLGYIGDLIDSVKLAQTGLLDLLTVLAYLVVMLWISPPLTLLVLVFAPLVHLSIRWTLRRIRQSSQILNQATLAHHSMTQNVLSSIALFKAFAGEERVSRQFEETRERLRRVNLRINMVQGLVTPVQEVLVLLVLLILIGVVALVFGDQGPGRLATFLVFFYAVRSSVPRLIALQEKLAILAARRPQLEELSKVLDDDDKHVVADGTVEFEGLRDAIEVRGLHFAYSADSPVLKGIDARFEVGKKTALVGPSGGGKSTLVQLLLRLYDVPQGTVFLDETDIRSFRTSSLLARVGLVPQEVLLFHDTLRANLLVGAPEAPDEVLLDALRRARLGSLIERLPEGLDALVGDRGVQLSGGQRQRVAICRAILRDPEILILDEATSALDSETESLVQASIQDLLEGRTSIVIAHRLSTVADADEVIVLEDGVVSEHGPPVELLGQEGRLAELWRGDFAGPRPGLDPAGGS